MKSNSSEHSKIFFSTDDSLAAIRSMPLIDSLLDVICRTTGMGFAVVARVTDKEWIACAVKDDINFGLQVGGTLPLQTTLCHEISRHHHPVVIDNVLVDATYTDHPCPEMYGFQSYISYPIISKNGDFFGTLCAIDPKPNKLTDPTITGMFQLFAELISFHLEAVGRLSQSEANLEEEKRESALREQFIAILGHDLRNPVTAVSASAQLLLQLPLEESVLRVARLIKNSTVRISTLIDNMLDFARGRLGNGIEVTNTECDEVVDVLKTVIAEILATSPDVKIETDFQLSHLVKCDCNRVAQLFSNLLTNAVTYGRTGAVVRVNAITQNNNFILSVINEGKKIPDDVRSRLFQPFSRGVHKAGHNGLGLGLYIAAEIAKAHHGTLTADSTDEFTVFTLTIPQ